MELIKECYEIKDCPDRKPYAMLETREAWIKSENKTPVRISMTTVLNTGPSQHALMDIMCTRPRTYALHTGDITVPITKSMFDTLRARTRKPLLRDLVLLFDTGNGAIIKAGCVGIENGSTFDTKLHYAEMTREFEESPDDVPDPTEPDWIPIENLDKRKYQIFRAQEKETQSPST